MVRTVGSNRYPLPEGVTGGAEFNMDGTHRHLLTRRWSDGPRYALWLGLNPSVARDDMDDPTMVRETKLTRLWFTVDYLVKMNVLDICMTKPANLRFEPIETWRTPGYLERTIEIAQDADVVIVGWGVVPNRVKPMVAELVSGLMQAGVPLICTGYAQDGSPRHPLYVGYQGTTHPWPRPRSRVSR